MVFSGLFHADRKGEKMTAQVGDIFRHKEEKYILLRQSARGLFDPYQYGFNPSWVITSCMRGYRCGYEIASGNLILQTLSIHDENDCYPLINGVEAEKSSIFGGDYYDLNLRIPYSGKILLGSNLNDLLIIEPPSWFDKLLEYEFDDGILVKSWDHIETAKMIRESDSLRFLYGEELREKLPDEIRKTVWWD